MEQPRFGGVALPPLSTPDGEGMSQGSVTNTMESTQFQTVHLPQVTQDEHAEVSETSQSAARDDDVQKIMEVLRQLGISTDLEQHKLKHERQRQCGSKQLDKEIYCKNLLLKDKKGQVYLILCGENDTADLHVVKYHLNVQGNLHFASKNSLWNLLRVSPGAVSPLALIHCSGDVRVFMDATLVNQIDQDTTKLYFHPLKADLQVWLTLSQLKKFLHHCNVKLELLPSLNSYSAHRRFTLMKDGYHWKLKSYQKRKSKSKSKESGTGQMQEERNETVCQQTTQPGVSMEQAENLFTKHIGLDQHGVTVETVSAKGNVSASDYTILHCRCVYLKDKRNNYFLFICHENQKIDFSNLKMHLKPKKKIEPLTSEELWSLLHIQETQQHPFVLTDLKQPQFLVAIADNLYSKSKTVLTFPHPSDCSLRLKITLKGLKTFISNTSHDLTTIQVKGKIDELQAVSVSSICPSSSAAAQLNSPLQNSEPEDTEQTHSSVSEGEEHSQLNSPLQNSEPENTEQTHASVSEGEEHYQILFVPAFSSARHINNLFFHLTAPLRTWSMRCIRILLRFVDQYLPSRISVMLHRLPVWKKMPTSDNSGITEDWINQNEESLHRQEDKEKERMAKIAKLEQLIERSGIQASLTMTHPQARFLKDDAERCRTYLLEDRFKRLYFVFCTEDDDPSQRSLRCLRTAFRSRSALQLATDTSLSHHLSWTDGSDTVSWTQEDLNPMATMDMDLQALGRVRAGITGALYLFPDTTLNFDLPPLGITLRISSNDLEKLIKQLGFCVVYFP